MVESISGVSKEPPVCCYCDHDLSCDHCGMEQPYTDISILKSEIARLTAQVEQLTVAMRDILEECDEAPTDNNAWVVAIQNIVRTALQSTKGEG